ncbi:hypothetical protein K502DRAFT_325067 [Neoconidiobolus thromboides FSU 785]|nr:hypothetical protein K502DRAFT_325067 [Neoconidiobolus thromboides FSU 785]
MSSSHRSRSQSPDPKKLNRRISFNAKSYWDELSKKREKYERERSSLSIYTSPLKVLGYFLLYALDKLVFMIKVLRNNRFTLSITLMMFCILYSSLFYEGPHKILMEVIKGEVKFYGYWLLLGIASSIGLGTGLHTFVLFLGPHVAEITMVAYECGSLDFDIRGENKFICQPDLTNSNIAITPFLILLKVLPQSIIWGFGTALGELPPYFIARAAAYAGKGNEELEQLEQLSQKDITKLSYKQRLFLTVYQLLKITGFMGIFICASIPNPLFDLAGITCGHFMIPFSTFFSAVVLGKAFVKSSLQVLIIIVMFSKETIQKILEFFRPRIPFLYDMLVKMISEQTKVIREGNKSTSNNNESNGIIPLLWNSLIALMMLYFLFSIIESLALTYLQQTQETELSKLEKRKKKKHSRSNSVYF